jgi:Membrane bound beta barrel domain (DUF5777)
MKRYFWLIVFLLPVQLFAQDTTANDLLKDTDKSSDTKKAAVEIFNTQRAINANTTVMVGKGKMDFRITHYFDDIAGGNGSSVLQRFLGLDNARDIRIGFHIGLTDNLDVSVARVKGAGTLTQNSSGSVLRFFEFSLKYRFMEQRENDPSHPLAMALFVSNAISSVKKNNGINFENSFANFSDRMSQAVQLIIARKFGKVSLSLNPTYVHTNHVVLNDDKGMFALGGAIRVPITKKFNFLVDYFHPFRSASSKKYFGSPDSAYTPPSDPSINYTPFSFYDPLGIGFEIVTAGHVFSLNFTNALEILENRFIRFTNKSWSKGQYRWCFTISRKFVLWRSKK